MELIKIKLNPSDAQYADLCDNRPSSERKEKDLYADVQKWGSPNPSVREPAPPAELTKSITEAVREFPNVIGDLIARYVIEFAHEWYAPANIPWPALTVTSKTVALSKENADQGDYPSPSSEWYRCASVWTLRQGMLTWSCECDYKPGWVAFGVISEDPRPVTVQQGDWIYGTALGKNSRWLAVFNADDRESKVHFSADEMTHKITASRGKVTVTWDFSPEVFYNLRPAVLIGGRRSATIL